MLNYITVPVLFLPAADAKPLFKLQVAESRRIEGVLTFEVHAARYAADEWIVVAAEAPQLPGQIVVTTKMEPAGVAGQELGPLQRPIVVARLPAKANHLQKGFKIEVSYQAMLRSHNLVPLKPSEKPPRIPPLAADTRQLLLAPSETLDFKAALRGRSDWSAVKSESRSNSGPHSLAAVS